MLLLYHRVPWRVIPMVVVTESELDLVVNVCANTRPKKIFLSITDMLKKDIKYDYKNAKLKSQIEEKQLKANMNVNNVNGRKL